MHLQDWQIACDPDNCGREQGWSGSVLESAAAAPVPGIIQQVFPNYHGVAWYWTRFTVSAMLGVNERLLLRFGAVDYLAEVWVNGVAVGGHEGGETPFELDVTAAARAGANLLAVRVLNPTNEPIDGLALGEIPHRNKSVPPKPGNSYNYGGILLPVELVTAPAVRIVDLFPRPEWRGGAVPVTVTVRNDTNAAVRGRLAAGIAPRHSGELAHGLAVDGVFPPGFSTHELTLMVEAPRLWSPDDPFLYQLDVDLEAETCRHRQSVRAGFRDFRVEYGWFVLNGKRLFLKSTHTTNHFPIGQVVPPNPDLLRRDLIYAKACGYNCVRFIAGMAWPEQLDCCDEIGLMVYEECLASWWAGAPPPPFGEPALRRFDLATREMILRDRHHPSVTIWGLLNETPDGPLFRRAAAALPWARELDPTRLILLSSGRWDRQPSIGSVSNPGGMAWEHVWGAEAPGAPEAAKDKTGGDTHVYPNVPATQADNALIRDLGRDTKPVFLSEYGIGSLMDVIGETRKFEQAGCRPDLHDCAFVRGLAARLETDWKRWGFEGTYPFAEDMLRDSQRLHMRQRRMNFDLVRSNPRLCGYNLTGMLDHGLTGEGLWTYWRELKPLAADTLRDGWAPLRWCLFVTPSHGYANRPVELEAVLANEDALAPGDYPVTFRVTGARGTVWERKAVVTVPTPPAGERGPLAIPVLKTKAQLKVPAGEYVFAARLEHGGAPAGDRKEFTISDFGLPFAGRMAVTGWGLEKRVAGWLKKQGVAVRPFTAGAARTPEVILVGKPGKSRRDDWCSLVRRVARGGVAVFLEPDAFQRESDATHWLPLARKGERVKVWDWLYHKECVAKRHPIFAGLQAGGILDWDYYGQLVSHEMFAGQDDPDEMVCAAFYPCMLEKHYGAGAMLAAYRLGAGQFILNTLNVCGQLGDNPAADRLLLNVVSHARGKLPKRLAPAPADLDDRLKREIYPPAGRTDFVKTWRVTAATSVEPPARAIEPPAADVAWSEPKTFANGLVDYFHLHGPIPGLVYAEARIDVPRAMEVELLLGTDGPLKIWIGEQELVVVEKATNPCLADTLAFPVKLAAGAQSVRVAFCRRGGVAWGFFLRFRRPDRPWTDEELGHRQYLPRIG